MSGKPEFTSDFANGFYRGFVERCLDDNNRYITIPTEDLWNGVQMTIIYITILTEDLDHKSSVILILR
jgi:hypothetical protein